MMKQMSFDDLIDNRIVLGDWVEVTARPQKGQDIETYYYLKEHTGKKGEVVHVFTNYSKICFEVNFHDDNHFRIFNIDEVTKIKGGKSK